MKKLNSLCAIACTVSLSFIITACAGLEEMSGGLEGSKALMEGDYVRALKELRPLAEQGNAEAQNNLGFMYMMGLGVPKNYAEAEKWFRKAAEQGDTAAKMNLELMHANGRGVQQDDAEAEKLRRKASAH